MVESVTRTNGQAIKISHMQIRNEAHTVNTGYFSEHTTKEKLYFLLLVVFPLSLNAFSNV